MNNRTLPLGLSIVAAGIFIALGKLGVFGALAAWLWPLLPLAAGVALHFGVWSRRLPTVVYLPGALLSIGSIALLLCAWFGWTWMKALWPLFPLSIAVGLYEFAAAERLGTMRAVSLVAGAVSLLLLLITLLMYVNAFVVALLLVVAGVALAARRPDFR
ncbi:hypothetical protein [Paenibacillus sp.]|uniref:hypothetical protein n=1 Tax=Paenibacillus sp. TaxID=58172 RepID=UPI002D5453C8|nr:hypothetical protein [Paenibacillus sp.]HZG88295.1 hypothetical protein [Paenibacillus sp.]